jgi:hypothetical protein
MVRGHSLFPEVAMEGSEYCPKCGIHNHHASPGCIGHGTDNPEGIGQADAKATPQVSGATSSEGAKPAAIDASKTDADLIEQFENEAHDAGYTQLDGERVARERLADLRAGGTGNPTSLS